MTLPFVNRHPTDQEVEKLRLILSTYQDGTGMLRLPGGQHETLPGWRDFERACALVFNGIAVESKFFVDVIFPLSTNPDTFYGIDCKMRRELRSVESRGRLYVEVTNAANYLWSYLASKGVTKANYREEPELAGNSLIEAVEHLKKEGSSAYPAGPILADRSYYLILLWSTTGNYQLYQLSLDLPNPGDLAWTCHVTPRRDSETTRLVGANSDGVLYEWYGDSGGQLKYYPPISEAVWNSNVFQLEPLGDRIQQGILAKAAAYFPDLWAAVRDQ